MKTLAGRFPSDDEDAQEAFLEAEYQDAIARQSEYDKTHAGDDFTWLLRPSAILPEYLKMWRKANIGWMDALTAAMANPRKNRPVEYPRRVRTGNQLTQDRLRRLAEMRSRPI